MNAYTSEIHESPLFKRFDRLPKGMDDISPDEIVRLKGFVLEIAMLVGPKMDKVGETFRQYTDHGLTHLCNIAKVINDFLPESKSKNKERIGLNALELTLLWAGILLHDTGMFVSEAEKEVDLKSDSYRLFLKRSKDRVEAAERAKKLGQPRRAQQIEEALVAEFYRRRHARRSNDFVKQHLSNRFLFREKDLAEVMGNIAESHNWPVFQRDKGLYDANHVAGLDVQDIFGSVPVNLQYIACCLRMGDIMDFDRSRTPLVIFENMDFTEDDSLREWNKHRSITGWRVSPTELVWKAECERPEYYVAVQEFLGWVDDELESFSRIVEGFRDKVAQRYPMPLPHRVKRDKVSMKNPNHITGAFKYQLEFEEIMQLLMDKSLYPDPALFLRELLQNSLDACRYQKALAIKEEMGEKYEPRIDVWDYSNDPEAPRIIFRDNGYGMDMRTIKQYFLRVGKSYYRSPDFAMERELLAEQGIFLDSCSRFGIGFLSCFLAGDKIEVETYRLGAPHPLRINITGPSRYFLIETLGQAPATTRFLSPKDRLVDGPPHHPGTKVTVYLKPGWRDGFEATERGVVYDTIHTYAVATEFPIMVHLNGGQSAFEIKGDQFSKIKFPSEYNSFILEPKRHPLQDLLTLVEIPLPIASPLLRFDGNLSVLMIGDWERFGGKQKSGFAISIEQRNSNELFDFYVVVTYENTLYSCILIFYQILYAIDSTVAYFPPSHRKDSFFSLVPEFISLWNQLSTEEKQLAQPIIEKLDRFGFESEMDCSAFLKGVNEDDHFEVLRQLGSKFKTYSLQFEIASFLVNKREIALHGILIPGGVLNWNPLEAQLDKSPILPDGIFCKVNITGEGSPRPNASRLYINPENAVQARKLLNEAVVLWAVNCLDSCEDDSARKSFFQDLCYKACLISPEVVLEHLEKLCDVIEIRGYQPSQTSGNIGAETWLSYFDFDGTENGTSQISVLGEYVLAFCDDRQAAAILLQFCGDWIKSYDGDVTTIEEELQYFSLSFPVPDDQLILDAEKRLALLKFFTNAAALEEPQIRHPRKSYETRTALRNVLVMHGAKLPIESSELQESRWGYIDLPIFQEAPLITDENGQQYRDLREWVKKYLPSMKIETDG